jgi:hypothetical protein
MEICLLYSTSNKYQILLTRPNGSTGLFVVGLRMGICLGENWGS